MIVQRLSADSADVIRNVSGAVLCSEDIVIQINRLGFSLRYVPRESAEWRSFTPDAADSPEFLLTQDGTICFGAFHDGQFIGLLSARLRNGWADIVDLRVDTAYRRKGIASVLLRECDTFARQHRLAGLRVGISDDNPVFCRFLQNREFVPEGFDRLFSSGNPLQRNKPRMLRSVTLYFYRPFAAVVG